MNSQRRLQIHHVVLESCLDDEVMFVAFIAKTFPRVLAHSVQGKHLDPREILFATGKHHAAFAGGDVLRRIEAEAAKVPEGPGRPAAIFRFNSVGTVFDKF